MATFDRAIPPGGEGKITITMNTEGYEGNFYKTTYVYTNDPKKDWLILGIRAFVRVPLSLRPLYILLDGREDVSITKSIEIKAALDKPLTLEPTEFTLDGRVTYKVDEIEKGRTYKITFTSVPRIAGTFSGYLDLKTNYEEKPVVTIRIFCQFKKAKEKEQ
ncbi:DUF1573 domain-containing protein [Thermodesulfobacteriota bacterium]